MKIKALKTQNIVFPKYIEVLRNDPYLDRLPAITILTINPALIRPPLDVLANGFLSSAGTLKTTFRFPK